MNFELIIFLVFTFYISVINSEKDSDEGKYIDLLPEEEKKDLLEKIALRILEEVQSNSTDVKSGEISDAQLNHHSQYVSNLLQEERENLRRKNNATVNAIKKKRNARSSDYDSIKVQGIEKDKTINEGVSNKLDNIDFTLREAKLTKNVKKKTKATIVLTTSTTEDFKTTDTGSITESSMDVIKSKLTNKNGRIVEIIDSDSSDDDRNDNNKHKPMKNSSRNVKGPDNTQIPVKIVYDNPTNPIQDKVGDRKSIDTEYPITGKVILYRDDSDVTKMYDFDPETTPDSDETITTPDTQTAKTNTVDDKNEATKETALTKSTVDNNLGMSQPIYVSNENIIRRHKEPIKSDKNNSILAEKKGFKANKSDLKTGNDEKRGVTIVATDNKNKTESDIHINTTLNIKNDLVNSTQIVEPKGGTKSLLKDSKVTKNKNIIKVLINEEPSNPISATISSVNNKSIKKSKIKRVSKPVHSKSNILEVSNKTNVKANIVPRHNDLTIEKILLTTVAHDPITKLKLANNNVLISNIKNPQSINKQNSVTKDSVIENGVETQINDAKTFLELQKVPDNEKLRKEHKVFEIPAGNTAFVLKNINGKKKEVNVPENHLERRTEVEETKYYVPVYNYAPNNAYFNPYNRLGPNADDKDRETDNFETKDTLGEERGGDISDNSEFENSGEYNRKYNYNQPYRSPHRSFVQQPNIVDHANDYFDMDYYFGRTNDRPKHKGREWRRKKEEKLNFNLGLRNSYDKDHSIERGKLKDLISDVRLLLHRNNIHLPIPDHSTTETEFVNTKSNGNKMKSPNNILRYSKYNRGNFLSLPSMKRINPDDIGVDYYVGRGQKTKIDSKQNQETPNLLMNYDSDYDRDDYRLLQDKSKKFESSEEDYYRSIEAELNNYQMKTKNQIKPFINKETMQMLTNMSDAKDVLQILLQLQQMQRARDSLLNPYLTVIEDMIKTDNKGLSQYDWLGSAVDVQAALKKMVDLTKQSQFGRNIHQSDLELLYYLSYLYQSAKDYLAASKKDQMQYNIHEDTKYLSKSTDNLSKINKYIYFNDYFDPRTKKIEHDKTITKGKVTLNDFLSEVKKLNLKGPSPLNIKEYLQRIKDVSLPNIRIFYPMKGKQIKRLDIPKDIEVKYNSNNDLEEKLLGILKDHSDKLKTFKPDGLKNTFDKVFKIEDLPRDINMDKISIDLSTLKRLKLHRRLNPRTQHKKSYRRLVNDVSPLVTIFHQPGESNFEDNLKEFRNDLIETQYALNDLHNAIKYISMISKPNSKLFRNLRELYLTNPTKKLPAEVLLHLTATRLIGLVEDSFKQDLGKDYLKYVEDNEETVRKTRDEFVFVLRLLEEIKDLEE